MFGTEVKFGLLIPEMIIIGMIFCLGMAISIFRDKFKYTVYVAIQTGLIISIAIVCVNFKKIQRSVSADLELLLQNGLIASVESNLCKLVLVTLVLFWLIYVQRSVQQHVKHLYAYLSFILLLLLGSMLLVASNGFGVFYVGIELGTIASCGLIAITQDLAGKYIIKYFKFNIIFSLLLLYGLSLIYGVTGSLEFVKIIDFVRHQYIPGGFHAGVILVLSVILFKLYLFPFQTWVPDLYERTSTIVLGLLTSLPLVSFIGFYSYLVKNILVNYFDHNWQILSVSLALISMLLGSWGGMLQVNLKRMLGYTVISNVGMMCLGLFTNKLEGINAANVSAIIYTGMWLSIIGVFVYLRAYNIELRTLEDLVGLSQKKPIISVLLLGMLLALIGVPPTAGFYAKFLIIKSLISAELTLVALAVLLISLLNGYSCIRLIKYIYTAPTEELKTGLPILRETNLWQILRIHSTNSNKVKGNYAAGILLWFNFGWIILLGIFILF